MPFETIDKIFLIKNLMLLTTIPNLKFD